MHFNFVVRFPIHRVVLAGASDYFKTAFSSNWNNNNNNEVTFTVQENEIGAFKAVLKFFYTSVIPEDILICEILKMFRLGDALICSFMTQNIERRLAAASSDLQEQINKIRAEAIAPDNTIAALKQELSSVNKEMLSIPSSTIKLLKIAIQSEFKLFEVSLLAKLLPSPPSQKSPLT